MRAPFGRQIFEPRVPLAQAFVGDDYVAEVGYIRRKGYAEINPTFAFCWNNLASAENMPRPWS